MAGWLAPAAGIGLGIADALGGGPKSYNPWEQGDAAWRVNNPSRWTPFGSIEYSINPGEKATRKDDTYEVRQTLSPEMQALADRLLGMAGRGRETFSSGGPGARLQNILAQRLGGGNAPTYDRGAYGFGQSGDPAMVSQEDQIDQQIENSPGFQELLENLKGTGGSLY